LARYYRELSPKERRERVVLQPAYRDAYNAITDAHQLSQVPRYFWRRWVPELGPTASMVYMRLRDLCFSRAGVDSGVCDATQDELAQAAGIAKRHTVGAALRLLERWGFIAKKRVFERDEAGQFVRAADQISVFFEIPLHVEDAVELLIREAQQTAIEYEHREAEKRPQAEASDAVGPKNGLSVEVVDSLPRGRKTASKTLELTVETKDKYRCFSASVVDSPQGALALELAEELEDARSAPFFLRCARKIPEAALRRLLSETRCARREGTLRGRPGAYFTAAVKREAREMGIAL